MTVMFQCNFLNEHDLSFYLQGIHCSGSGRDSAHGNARVPFIPSGVGAPYNRGSLQHHFFAQFRDIRTVRQIGAAADAFGEIVDGVICAQSRKFDVVAQTGYR